MAIINRKALKNKFKSGAIPTPSDFCDIIDSAINRTDDCFAGKWQPNCAYKQGDVVIYKKSMYMFLPEDVPEVDCDDDSTVTTGSTNLPAQKAPESKVDPEGESNEGNVETVCSSVSPDKDEQWCMLQFEIEDEDWKLEEVDGEWIMTPKKEEVSIGVGIGDAKPQAIVDVKSENRGQFLIDPKANAGPMIRLINLEPNLEGNSLTTQVSAQYAEMIANTPYGFVFKKSVSKDGNDKKRAIKAIPLMVVQGDDNENPKVGIGTLEPEAGLDITREGKGKILLQPGTKPDPEILLVNLDPSCFQNYLATNVGTQYAAFTTDADGGFHFNKGIDYHNYKSKKRANDGVGDKGDENADTNLMTINGDGKVGIGTDQPKAHVEVVMANKGSFLMSLEKTNPAFAVVNTRPSPNNYLTIGADNHFGILVTDSDKGFVFRAGEEYGKGGPEQNVNQGEDLLNLTREGKLGLKGINPEYEIDVPGIIRSNGLYLDTDRKKIKDACPLKEALEKDKTTAIDKICSLTPILFNWKNEETCIGDAQQLGLYAHEVDDVFKQAVKTNVDGSQSVAYQNLVAALIEGMKEQQEEIKDLKNRLNKLEGNKGYS